MSGPDCSASCSLSGFTWTMQLHCMSPSQDRTLTCSCDGLHAWEDYFTTAQTTQDVATTQATTNLTTLLETSTATGRDTTVLETSSNTNRDTTLQETSTDAYRDTTVQETSTDTYRDTTVQETSTDVYRDTAVQELTKYTKHNSLDPPNHSSYFIIDLNALTKRHCVKIWQSLAKY